MVTTDYNFKIKNLLCRILTIEIVHSIGSVERWYDFNIKQREQHLYWMPQRAGEGTITMSCRSWELPRHKPPKLVLKQRL